MLQIKCCEERNYKKSWCKGNVFRSVLGCATSHRAMNWNEFNLLTRGHLLKHQQEFVLHSLQYCFHIMLCGEVLAFDLSLVFYNADYLSTPRHVVVLLDTVGKIKKILGWLTIRVASPWVKWKSHIFLSKIYRNKSTIFFIIISLYSLVTHIGYIAHWH